MDVARRVVWVVICIGTGICGKRLRILVVLRLGMWIGGLGVVMRGWGKLRGRDDGSGCGQDRLGWGITANTLRIGWGGWVRKLFWCQIAELGGKGGWENCCWVGVGCSKIGEREWLGSGGGVEKV